MHTQTNQLAVQTDHVGLLACLPSKGKSFAHAPRREHVIALTRRGSAAALTDGDSP